MIKLKQKSVSQRDRKFSLSVILFIVIVFSNSCSPGDKTSDKEQFVEKLLAEMTLEEKVGQMNLIPYEGNNPEELRAKIEKVKLEQF